MARAHFADVLIGTSGTGALSLLDGATVHVYDQGTTNHIAQTLYAADSGGTTIANPLTSDANGKVEFWLDTPARVDLVASKTGFSPSTRTVDVEDVPIAVSGTPTIGDTLVYDGTKYVPQVPSGGGSSASPLALTVETWGQTLPAANEQVSISWDKGNAGIYVNNGYTFSTPPGGATDSGITPPSAGRYQLSLLLQVSGNTDSDYKLLTVGLGGVGLYSEPFLLAPTSAPQTFSWPATIMDLAAGAVIFVFVRSAVSVNCTLEDAVLTLVRVGDTPA